MYTNITKLKFYQVIAFTLNKHPIDTVIIIYTCIGKQCGFVSTCIG